MTKVGPGTVLDRYEVLELVAEGGMGQVWSARLAGKHGFARKVALKTMRPELAQKERFRRMLLDEARIASRIDHPNVLRIVDLGESSSGVLYVVMDWVDGATLRRLSRAQERRGARLPLPIVTRLVLDVCAGLHAAHELVDDAGAPLGVVHRDVSPDNVLVSVTGYARLADFGIAKARERLTEETTTGSFRGKVGFVAPEQAMGLYVDRRSDVWAVGAVLHRLLTGVVPFPTLEDLVGFVNGELAVTRAPHVPDVLFAIVVRALALRPDERYATANLLALDLEAASASLGGIATSNDVGAEVRRALQEAAEEALPTVDLGATSPAVGSEAKTIPRG